MRIKTKNQPDLTIIDFRDGQQSALDFKDINFNSKDWAKVLSKATKVGFKTAEVAGGQNFQSAIKNGYNPIAFLESLGVARLDKDGRKAIDFQMLFRGANALGFKPYSPKVIEATLKEFTQAGVDKIRFFDALNDIDNIYIPESIKNDPEIIKQGALCFGNYKNQSERYANEYYTNYAKALVTQKGCNSIAIKDMSGQLGAERIAELLPALRKALKEASPNEKIPIELHMHSTNERGSLDAIRQAIRLNIDAIETVEGPLSGGAAHNSIDAINNTGYEDSHYIHIDAKAHVDLKQALAEVFKGVVNKTVKRSDSEIDTKYRDKLCAAGVPGGAMPVVLNDLRKNFQAIIINNPEYFANNQTFEKVIDLFVEELGRVCRDANYPLLVTPTADICTKQAINNMQWRNLAKDTLEARYGDLSKGIDSRFVKLLLGHYGRMREYSDSRSVEFHKPEQSVLDFFNGRISQDAKSLTAIYDDKHPYTQMIEQVNGKEYDDARKAAEALYEKYGFKAKSFATLDQLTVMYAVKPYCEGNGDIIEKALKTYISRTQKATTEKYQVTLPLGIQFIIQPLLDHLETIIAFGRKAMPENLLDVTLKEFAGVGERIYDTYKHFISENKLIAVIPNLDAFKEFKLGDFISSLMKQVQEKVLLGAEISHARANEMIEVVLAKIRERLKS